MAYLTWHNLPLIPIVVVLALALAAFTLWLYPTQLRTVRRPWRWIMPTLRVAALVTLAISILKPVIVRPKTAQEQGAIVVLVDRSRSMSIADAARSPAQLVAIADGLGRLAEGLRDPGLPALRREIESLRFIAADVVRAQSELDYAKLTSRDAVAAQQRLETEIARYSEAVQSLPGRATTLPSVADLPNQLSDLAKAPPPEAKDAWKLELPAKLDRAGSAIDVAQQQADAALYAANVDVKKICDDLSRLTRLQLVESALTTDQTGLLSRFDPKSPLYGFSVAETSQPLGLRSGEVPVQRLLIEPTGSGSDLTSAVREVIDTLRGQPIQAIVLLSDGRQVGGESVVASTLSVSGVPIFAVPVAAALSRDVSVQRLTVPGNTFVGETMTVRAELFSAGMKGQSVDVTLKLDDHTETKTVSFPDDGITPITFEVKLEKAGAKLLAVEVKPQDGETSVENNSVHRWVKVMDDKIKVASISFQPGWDYQYIRNALARTPWVTLEDFTLQTADQKLPWDLDKLKNQDIVILYDVPPACLSDEQWDAVHQLVKDRGASTILLAGSANLPALWSKHVLLSDLLPYRAQAQPKWQVWPGETASFRIEPSKDAGDSDVLKLSDDPAEAMTRWQTLPAMYRHLPLTDLKPNTRTLLVERQSQSPVLTESRLGLGRVLFAGIDETWRWRFKIGERDQDRFWLQLVRYAAEPPYAAQKGGVALDAERISIDPGTGVRVRARVLTTEGLPSKEPTQKLRVMRGTTNVQTITLEALSPESGRYEGVVSGLDEGDYKLQLVASDDLPEPVEMPLQVMRSLEPEVADLSGDEKMMKRLADASGGHVVPLTELKHLPEMIAEIRQEKSTVTELSLWDSPYLFVFVLACLGAEWAMRKQFGLA